MVKLKFFQKFENFSNFFDTQRLHELSVEKSKHDYEYEWKPRKSKKQHSFAFPLFRLIEKSFSFKETLKAYTDFFYLRILQTQPFLSLTVTFKIRPS